MDANNLDDTWRNQETKWLWRTVFSTIILREVTASAYTCHISRNILIIVNILYCQYHILLYSDSFVVLDFHLTAVNLFWTHLDLLSFLCSCVWYWMPGFPSGAIKYPSIHPYYICIPLFIFSYLLQWFLSNFLWKLFEWTKINRTTEWMTSNPCKVTRIF